MDDEEETHGFGLQLVFRRRTSIRESKGAVL